jgi:hypothetical protein
MRRIERQSERSARLGLVRVTLIRRVALWLGRTNHKSRVAESSEVFRRHHTLRRISAHDTTHWFCTLYALRVYAVPRMLYHCCTAYLLSVGFHTARCARLAHIVLYGGVT